MSQATSDVPTPAIGGTGTCRGCGKRGARRQNLPDDPPDARPRHLACSADCARRIMSGEFGPWSSIGWIK